MLGKSYPTRMSLVIPWNKLSCSLSKSLLPGLVNVVCYYYYLYLILLQVVGSYMNTRWHRNFDQPFKGIWLNVEPDLYSGNSFLSLYFTVNELSHCFVRTVHYPSEHASSFIQLNPTICNISRRNRAVSRNKYNIYTYLYFHCQTRVDVS